MFVLQLMLVVAVSLSTKFSTQCTVVVGRDPYTHSIYMDSVKALGPMSCFGCHMTDMNPAVEGANIF